MLEVRTSIASLLDNRSLAEMRTLPESRKRIDLLYLSGVSRELNDAMRLRFLRELEIRSRR
jgi:hypothetical protein